MKDSTEKTIQEHRSSGEVVKEIFQSFFTKIYSFKPQNMTEDKVLALKVKKAKILPSNKVKELEGILGISIKESLYFELALIHRSALQVPEYSTLPSNERLEFLGDAILDMIVAEYLFSLHTNVPEGELTKMRSLIVNGKTLAHCASVLHLEQYVILSYSARQTLSFSNSSILADAIEAIIAAIYLDSGLKVVTKFFLNTLLPIIASSTTLEEKNYKSMLLEEVQSHYKTSPKYRVLHSEGPAHSTVFTIGVYINEELIAEGTGKSKKEAEQIAANKALLIKFPNIILQSAQAIIPPLPKK
ncbi:MAG: ribonuclease III [Candidatus Kapabacteria bacterium]|nr:ribonuclease III [Candidatus Kapabacteria bacterium]